MCDVGAGVEEINGDLELYIKGFTCLPSIEIFKKTVGLVLRKVSLRKTRKQ